MNVLSHHKCFALAVMAVFGTLTTFAWAVVPTKFSNTGSIANTRHNMTQSTASGSIAGNMTNFRNDYGEVCVYCHTPHGRQTLAQIPLWNRTVKATTYTTYNSSSLTQGTAPQPGNNSLTCLTCHDGQTAIDSIINMPGSGRGNAGQATAMNIDFLNSWTPGTGALNHTGLNSSINTGGYNVGDGTGWPGCLGCHNPGEDLLNNYPDFTLFNIGTDLTNDHPVGIDFPLAASGVGYFNQPGGTKGNAKYFDINANGQMDKNEVRLYGTSGTVRVECSSCHDPHGVPDPENGNVFKPTFLRVKNGGTTGSALCLTCHDK